MNRKKNVMITAAALVLIIGGSLAAYRYLESKNTPESPIFQTESSAVGSNPSLKGENENVSSEEEEKMEVPDFTVTDAEGTEIKLSDLRGKPVVVNFWATWCGYCKMEMEDFEKVFQEQGDEIQFMMVDIVDGQRETVEKGTDFIAEQEFTFPVYFDTKQEAAYAYGINSLPTTLFIDKDGYLVAAAQQMIDQKTLEKGIDMIAGK